MNTNSYKIFRTLFIVGNVLSLILIFVPSVRVSTSEGEILMSSFDVLRLLSLSGDLSKFLFYLLLGVVGPILWIVLAIVRPKQWVFLGGASVAAFGLLLSLFQGSDPTVESLLIVQIFGYAALLLVMVGFVTKPPPPATA